MPKSKRSLKKSAIPTRDDVCRATGVSTATVSRVFNNQPGVGAEVRQKVLDAAKKLRYVPQAAARNLSRSKTDTLGVVFQDLTSGWFVTILRGVMKRASGSYQILNALSTMAGDEFDLPNKMLASRQVDGLIWLDLRASPTMISRINKLGAPFVVLQQALEDKSVNTVRIENSLGAYEGVRHFLELGYRNIWLLTGVSDDPSSQLKLSGALRAMNEAHVPMPEENIIEGHHGGDLAIAAVERHLEEGHKLPEAIFCFNDDMAIAILLWLRARGVRVPEEVALIGFDGIPEAAHVGLSTIETPMYEMGVLAAQRLIELIENPSAGKEARQILLNGSLRVRETCGAHLEHIKK